MSDEERPTEEHKYVSPQEVFKAKMKARAKEFRQAAYAKAKVKHKADRLAFKNSPAGEEQRVRLKEKRRQAYGKSKDSHKSKEAEIDAKTKVQREQEAAEAQALKSAELLKSLTTGDELKPKLRLVRND